MFKTDPENGMLIGQDGCHYRTPQQAFHYSTLGMCGCGNPEGAYEFIRKVLTAAKNKEVPLSTLTTEIVKDDPGMAAHVLLHFLNKVEVLEHGGSVNCSWLTEEGEEIADLPTLVDED